MPILIDQFSGRKPRIEATKLSPNEAVLADNCNLYSGVLRGWKRPNTVASIPLKQGIKTIYKYGSDWLFFTQDVEIWPSPINSDAYARTYLTGLDAPRLFVPSDITHDSYGRAVIASRLLGVPAPSSAPTVTVAGGSGTVIDTRNYALTFVSEFGEESAPSPATASYDIKSGDTVTLSALPTSAPVGYNAITKKRIYRTKSTSGGSVQWRLVAEIPLATASYVDSIAGSVLVTELPSTTWLTPPTGMHGMVPLPCGSFAGFFGNVVCFSEPYYPHAWPLGYQVPFSFPIVALATEGSTLIILTTAYTYFMSVPHPSTVSLGSVSDIIPCKSKRAVASTKDGVLFPSSDGLYLASGGRATLITESFFTREDWTAINPDTMLGVTVDNKYLSFYAQGSDPAGFVFDPVSGEIAFTDLDLYATAFFASPSDDKLYLAQESPDGSTNIVCWEGDSLRMFFDWKSKLFSLDTPEELSAYRVLADFSQGAVGQVDTSLADPRWGALDSVELNSCPLGGAVINETQYRDNAPTLLFKLYLDGLLAFQDYITDSSPARLPEASKAETAQVELIGNIPVRKVVVARSIEEAMS